MLEYKSLASYKVVVTTVINLAVLLSQDYHKVDNAKTVTILLYDDCISLVGTTL